MAVDSRGTVYVTDDRRPACRVAGGGSTSPVVLPFTGLDSPDGVAVGSDGTVYVTDYRKNQVFSVATVPPARPSCPLPARQSWVLRSAATEPFTSLTTATTGCCHSRQAHHQTVLPFDGLHNQFGVAVDSNGTVYVADFGNNRVLSLAAGSTTQLSLPFSGLSRPYGVAIDGKERL